MYHLRNILLISESFLVNDHIFSSKCPTWNEIGPRVSGARRGAKNLVFKTGFTSLQKAKYFVDYISR